MSSDTDDPSPEAYEYQNWWTKYLHFWVHLVKHREWSRLSTDVFSVQFSRSGVSSSLRSHGLQHARVPCPSPTPGANSNSCPIASVMPSNHLILCCPLLLLPSIFPRIRVFSKELVLCIRWPKYWSFSFNISPSNEYSGLISFRIDQFDLLAVQEALKSLLQHHSSKASVLWLSAFFIVQLSHPYMTTGKTIALTRRTFVGKVMSLLFHMLSRLVIAFLPRSKCLLISLVQAPSDVFRLRLISVHTAVGHLCNSKGGKTYFIV